MKPRQANEQVIGAEVQESGDCSNVFRGNYSASIDDRGRVRLPSAFLGPIRETFDDELFVTSIYGDCIRVYPMEKWLEIEKKLMDIPSMNPSRSRLLGRLTFYGQVGKLDKVGRLLLPQRLRASASLNGEVAVLGYIDYLEIWDPDSFTARLESEPLTDDDRKLLSDLGI